MPSSSPFLISSVQVAATMIVELVELVELAAAAAVAAAAASAAAPATWPGDYNQRKLGML